MIDLRMFQTPRHYKVFLSKRFEYLMYLFALARLWLTYFYKENIINLSTNKEFMSVYFLSECFMSPQWETMCSCNFIS